MNDLIHQVLGETKFKIESFQKQMNEFEKNPMVLLTEVFTTNDLFLPILIQRYGDDVLLEVQRNWFDRLFPVLKEFLGVPNLYLSYDETIYPAPIEIYIQEDLIALLEITSHHFERIEVPEIVELKERLNSIESEILDNEEQLKEQEPALKNPLVLGGANVIKLMDISIRKKKYRKETLDHVQMLQDHFFELQQEKVRVKSRIDQLNKLNSEREYAIDRIKNRIMNLPGYVDQVLEYTPELNDDEEYENIERGAYEYE